MRAPTDLCACRHPLSAHTEWWDGTDDGFGTGFGCVECACNDFEDPDRREWWEAGR